VTITSPAALPDISADCRSGKRDQCFGYISPLISGQDRPCEDPCHADGTGHERDFNLAVAHAELRRQRQLSG
jgi:hypothetical protein